MSTTRYSSIEHVIPTIERYVNQRIPTGGFMEAVLSNDLVEACSRADNQNRYLLFDIVSYLYNNVPGACWGSRERVDRWLSGSVEL